MGKETSKAITEYKSIRNSQIFVFCSKRTGSVVNFINCLLTLYMTLRRFSCSKAVFVYDNLLDSNSWRLYTPAPLNSTWQ